MNEAWRIIRPLGLRLAMFPVVLGAMICEAGMPGDVNGDGKVDCADLAIVKRALGKKAGQPGFESRADVVNDGIIDVRDLALVAKYLPAGSSCPK